VNHLPNLIIDLTIILTAGGIVTLLFKKLKQPLVLGYILAGFLVSPNFHHFPTITDIKNIEIWSQIGVIFLLFSLGLEFSFKKLTQVGGTASVTAFVEIAGIGFVGFMVGTFLGWNTMDSLFLGGMLSLSSTIIIIRTFDELGIKTEKFVGVVLGTLILEDLLAILLMVLLSTIATGSGSAGDTSILWSILKLVFFLVLWFVSGIFFIPTILKKTKKLMNDETLLVVSIALCFIMVIFAVNAGFSKELGAFIMGSILAETKQREKIEHLVSPLKDLFGAIFFVSVGMLINLDMIIEYIVPIVILVLVILFVNSFITSAGAFLSGQPLKTSIQTGMSMAQIGEFSFIIATLGLSLGVISDFLYPIAVTVSAITTLTTPYMIKASPKVITWVEHKIPERVMTRLNNYTINAQSANATKDWHQMIKISITNSLIYSVILITIIFAFSRYLAPIFFDQFGKSLTTRIIASLITLVAMSPFLWAIIARNFKSELRSRLLAQEKYRALVYIVSLFKIALAVFFISFMLRAYFSNSVTVSSVIIILFFLVVFRKKVQRFYNYFEDRFKTNLNVKDNQAENVAKMAPWDSHIVVIKVPANSPIIGKKLSELQWREKVGVNVASIMRGEHCIRIPKANEIIYPYDELGLIGTDEQLAEMELIIVPRTLHSSRMQEAPSVVLHALTVQQNSPNIGKTIRNSGLKEKTHGLVVGIERDGQRFLNPESNWMLMPGDIVWIVGDPNKIQKYVD